MISTSQQLRDREGAKYGGSAEGIRQHYDIGNEFWPLVLDSHLSYSCAMFVSPQESLDTAQERKIDWHLDKSSVDRSRSVLDIGCGWGAVLRRLSALSTVERTVGLTLSEAQAEYVRGLNLSRVEVRVESWSVHEPTGPYDSIISIGAFEHFAKREETPEEKIAVYRDFFHRCHRWLSPSGRMSLQTMAFGNMKREEASEFMNKEIFPDSDLPLLMEIIAALDGLFEIVSMRNDRLDYALTYDRYAMNLSHNRRKAVELVGEESVRRMERYFKLISIGFRTGREHLYRFALRPIVKSWTMSASRSWRDNCV
jgi:cyclopropane-fatty-acyl-phospholipid synthase